MKQTTVLKALLKSIQSLWKLQLKVLLESRHMVVCRVAKKASDHTVIILTGRNKTAFSRMHSSIARSPKHTIFAL